MRLRQVAQPRHARHGVEAEHEHVQTHRIGAQREDVVPAGKKCETYVLRCVG